MKKQLFSMVAIVLIAGFSTKMTAQNTDTESADATATIVNPITITKVTDLQFGTIVKGSGAVTVTTAGARTAVNGSTYLIPAGAGNGTLVTAASYTVSGQGTYTYAITLPANDVITIADGGSNTMAVNSFVSNPSATGALTGGTQTLLVGATLTVADTQVSGFYTGAFNVTVNYN